MNMKQEQCNALAPFGQDTQEIKINSSVFSIGEIDAKHAQPAHIHIRDRQEYLDGYVSNGGKFDKLSKEVAGTTYEGKRK